MSVSSIKKEKVSTLAQLYIQRKEILIIGGNIRIYFLTSIKALQPHTNNSLYHHQAIIISCFSTLIAVFIRLLVFYHQRIRHHIMAIFKHTAAALISFSSSLLLAMKENKAKMRYQRRVITSSRYLANIDFIIPHFSRKSITKFIVKALLESFFF